MRGRERSVAAAAAAALLVWLVLVVAEVAVAEVSWGGQNYKQAAQMVPFFFAAEMSGKLSEPGVKRLVDWRSDSGLTDGFEEHVDLVGGYYDAGDNVKFGLPMAFSMTILSWATLQYGKDMPPDLHTNILDAIKWGTDYIIKAHPDIDKNVLWVQVGVASLDHPQWERPEDMTTPRTAFKIDEGQPGSDVAAETAAALAAASIIFESIDSSYSQLLISHAISLFEFADKYRGVYMNAIPSSDRQFYHSSDYRDELLWGAAWLYRATKRGEYLEYVVLKGAELGGTGQSVKEFSWDNKYAGVQVLVSTDDTIWEQSKTITTNGEEAVKAYMQRAEYFVCANMRMNAAGNDNVDHTPQGLIYVRKWNNLEYATSAAFLLALYADHIVSTVTCPTAAGGGGGGGGVQITRDQILHFAESQVNYILGNNALGMSYLVGYGDKYPLHVHHRAASILKEYKKSSSGGSASAYRDWKASQNPNPHVLTGALVGGPDNNDNFVDDRNKFEQTEATMTGTATMFGILAARLSSTPSSHQQQQQKQQQPAAASSSSSSSSSVVSVAHAVTNSWKVKDTQYCRHRVVLENTSHNETVKDLRLRIDHLSARPFGLTQVIDHDDDDDGGGGGGMMYELPKWTNATILPRSQHTFVYVQQCAQAKITLLSYRT